MKKKFNVLGVCIPSKHYMVDTSNKLDKIQEMIDEGLYFTINCARQYGKTTTLSLLEKRIKDKYTVARMSFEGIGSLGFETADKFAHMFMEKMKDCLKDNSWYNENVHDFMELGKHITKQCEDKQVILMIDEVDKTSNNQVFIHFLGMLRSKYLDRNEERDVTFYSVILAGVYDIKNIKIKMVTEGLMTLRKSEGIPSSEGMPSLEGRNNSPWNIAAAFTVDMSFSPKEIETMLQQYENDHGTGMDVQTVSKEIHNYTNGYPFLVSRICQCIDVDLSVKDWSVEGIKKAVKMLLLEKNTLFDDMRKNMENYSDLREFIRSILIIGEQKIFTIDDIFIDFGVMFGYFKNNNGRVAISNKIFEIRMTNYFISRDGHTQKQITGVLKEDVVKNGRFDMALCVEKFAKHYYELFANKNLEFYERHGRLLFLSYLQPLINGIGFYHIEAQTRNAKRMDIVIDYGSDQFIVELKIWNGSVAHDAAYEQLLGYMDAKGLMEGYLLTFDFRKNVNKTRKAEWIQRNGKRIYDVIV